MACQRQGTFLFHGSDIVAEQLNAHQATNYGKNEAEPGVFATELPAIAVFHALSRTVKRSHRDLKGTKHGFMVNRGKVTLRGESNLLAKVKRSREPSNVYLLDKRDFSRKSEMEWHSKKHVLPLAVIFVRGRDLAGLQEKGKGITIETLP